MAFSDPLYLAFLVSAVLLVAWLPAGAPRLVGLIAVSYAFLVSLGSGWQILPVTTLITYGAGLALQRMNDGRARFWFFFVALCALLAPLLFFKYMGPLWNLAAPLPNEDGGFAIKALVLPIGLSFYTFLAVGYVIDVYVGNSEAEKSPFNITAMISFFPAVTSGPIDRGPHFLPQLANLGRPSHEMAVSGVRALLLGLVFKVVIADSLAPHVNLVFANPGDYGATDLALANLYFAFQVYADFAGYSLIAIGSALLLGIELPVNFRQPYFSETVSEFWRRWHMSLSSWFRDYVFTPLHFKTRRLGVAGMAGALVLTFVLVGIWHGAGLKFVIFGLIHGSLVAGSTLTLAARNRFWKRMGMPRGLLRAVRILATFGLVYLTLVLFRTSDATSALHYYQGMLGSFTAHTLPLAMPLALISTVLCIDMSREKEWTLPRDPRVRWACYYLAVAVVIGFTVLNLSWGNGDGQFIYYNF
jgi:Predicted membrane protein involved in D-alanine export